MSRSGTGSGAGTSADAGARTPAEAVDHERQPLLRPTPPARTHPQAACRRGRWHWRRQGHMTPIRMPFLHEITHNDLRSHRPPEPHPHARVARADGGIRIRSAPAPPPPTRRAPTAPRTGARSPSGRRHIGGATGLPTPPEAAAPPSGLQRRHPRRSSRSRRSPQAGPRATAMRTARTTTEVPPSRWTCEDGQPPRPAAVRTEGWTSPPPNVTRITHAFELPAPRRTLASSATPGAGTVEAVGPGDTRAHPERTTFTEDTLEA
ncbi:hypothetical protein EDD90_4680 [Streptomyces sp. Ag109_O5-1]|nr:hypothetical protein EDD90_4680 [Streptomyces sp. Ag109_O5-1]